MKAAGTVGAHRRTATGILGLLGPTWLVLGLLCLIPLAGLFVISFAQRGRFGGIAPVTDWRAYLRSGKIFSNYARSFDPLYLRIFGRSLWVAVVTTVLCIVISYPVAYFIAIVAPVRWRSALLVGVAVPFWTSFLIRTYAWILILRVEGLINTALLSIGIIHHPLPLLYNELAVTIGLVYGELPFMILPLYASLEKLDRSMLDAAADLGAGARSTFLRVTLPLTAPGLVAGTVLVFIPSIGQFIVSDLLGGGQSNLIGNIIQNQFTAARDKPFGSAIAFELTASVLALLLAYAIYARRRGGEELL